MKNNLNVHAKCAGLCREKTKKRTGNRCNRCYHEAVENASIADSVVSARRKILMEIHNIFPMDILPVDVGIFVQGKNARKDTKTEVIIITRIAITINKMYFLTK